MSKKTILKFQIEILKAIKEYSEKTLDVHNFQIYNHFINIIVLSLEDKTIKTVFDEVEDDEINYDEYKSLLDEIDKSDKNYDMINIESAYKLYFQCFEEFLYEIIYICFRFYPKYMNLSESKNEISLSKFFDDSYQIEDIRDFIISQKVKKIIQSNNIIDTIKKIERTFSIDFEIPKDNLDSIFVSSLKRNLLTHNNSIVNEIYLEQLKHKGIDIENLTKGDSISPKIEETIFQDYKNQQSIAKKINEKFLNDSNRLFNHHSKLT